MFQFYFNALLWAVKSRNYRPVSTQGLDNILRIVKIMGHYEFNFKSGWNSGKAWVERNYFSSSAIFGQELFCQDLSFFTKKAPFS